MQEIFLIGFFWGGGGGGGGRGGHVTHLPKFIFSAKFPIGLHVILKLQIKNSKLA